MKCIVGLGNPGKKYAKTRHNIGFMILDELVKQNHWSLEQTKFRGIYTTEHVNGEKILLLKPQTFMNLSGESLVQFMNFFDLEADDILVVYDDLDLPPGKIRLRKKGGHGGHNGIRNIIDHLGTKEFNRLRVGVGRPDGPVSVVDYVLGTFTKQEQAPVADSIDAAVKACEAWMTQPFNEVMNDFNAT
ncbi:aminoacyl-tRNA hydrolase [Halobacillus halophilus]|uniref:Peptidyl-tRNA hydrolase n=1 Tax=Halobacillus halophilus (strain ATCC 35676 / DSM 2266 / JCM 20832 / KCTC 3685 / LMG 17431 / NBRC 102448 / NCIMB 2269) TaxID=866895 RepID=I0JH34_HALH3|nr:aminoacyl-tRNA hydrolase [Halobacillus halophilus]ASF37677.1 aminoacyl-tRNA hydrolase [Halobacillus halophilus]CCG43452.1 peptidyl-tRNA hydrolase [Halobacillus halophilus DSM 2266]